MPHDATLAELKTLLGDRFSRSKADLDHHSRSESHFPPIAPHAVVWPLETAEVAAIMGICVEESCPVVGWGAGTSLEGHGLAVRGGVTVDFTRMDRILAVNAEDMDVRVQPGVTREALNTELRATGLFFPVDPGANATIGGMAANNSCGSRSIRYGTMRDNTLAIDGLWFGAGRWHRQWCGGRAFHFHGCCLAL